MIWSLHDYETWNFIIFLCIYYHYGTRDTPKNLRSGKEREKSCPFLGTLCFTRARIVHALGREERNRRLAHTRLTYSYQLTARNLLELIRWELASCWLLLQASTIREQSFRTLSMSISECVHFAPLFLSRESRKHFSIYLASFDRVWALPAGVLWLV